MVLSFFQKGEFDVKVPITYFSDAFQDILARDSFFISWKFKKMFLEKNPITFLKPVWGIFRENMKNFDFSRCTTNFHFRLVLLDILSSMYTISLSCCATEWLTRSQDRGYL